MRCFFVLAYRLGIPPPRTRAVTFESLIHVDTVRCAQLFDKWSDPTEVERLVKLGANGSGYKIGVRFLSRLSSRLSLRLPLSLFLSLLFLSLLLLPSKDNNVLTCPPFTRIPTPSSSSSSSLMMMMMFHLEMISFVTVGFNDCTYGCGNNNKPKCVKLMLSTMSKREAAVQTRVRIASSSSSSSFVASSFNPYRSSFVYLSVSF